MVLKADKHSINLAHKVAGQVDVGMTTNFDDAIISDGIDLPPHKGICQFYNFEWIIAIPNIVAVKVSLICKI